MGKIYFLKGLIGSGKSTKSKEIMEADSKAARVNKDSLRWMFMMREKNESMKGKHWEKLVVRAERSMVDFLLAEGYNVIVDNTHLEKAQKHEDHYRSVASLGNHDFEVIDLTHVPIEKCVEQDSVRRDSIGRNIIYNMAHMAGLTGPSQNKKIELEEKYIVVDLDGTLADISHRIHYVRDPADPDKKPNWNKFFDSMPYDSVRNSVLHLIRDTYNDYKVVIVTGRPESHRVPTENWLNSFGIKREAVLMREIGDYRKDTIIKQEILDKYLNKDLIEVCIDDRPSVIRMWEENGIKVIDVGDQQEF